MTEESPTPKLSDSDDDLHNWGMQLLDDGQSRRRPWEGVWWENIATFMSDFWVEFDPHIKRLTEPVKKLPYKARIPVNLAQPVVRTELAKLTKNRPILDPQPASNDRKDLNAAKTADKMLNGFVEREFHMPRVRRRMLHWVLMCGLGGTFVDYDDMADAPIEVFADPRGNAIMDEDKRQAFKKYYKRRGEQMQTMTINKGELVISAVSPFQLIWDFSKIYFEDALWCILSDVYDCDDAERRWGSRPEPDRNALPGVIERRLLSRIDLTDKLTVDAPKAQDMCVIHRLFVKPGHPFFPDGAEIVYDRDGVLEAKNFPFRHKKLPIALMGHVPLPVSQYSMSVIQHVRPQTIEVSKTVSQLVDNRNLMANPIWAIPKQVKLEGEIQNRPGGRIRYNHIPNVPPPSPVQMPEMPSYVPGLIELMKQFVLEISGQGETSQGRVPPGARSGVAIAYLQEEDDTRLGPTVSEFEEAMELTGHLTLETIAEKYTIPRTIRVARSSSASPDVFDFVGSMIDGATGVLCQAGSALPRSKAAKQQFILDLWDRQLEQDPRKVREMLELSSGEPDEWTIDLDQADRENRRLQNGDQSVVAEEWHNHPAHLYQHHLEMKTADWDAQPEDRKQVWRDHCEDHERLMAVQQQQVAGMGGAPPPELDAGQASAMNGAQAAANPANGQPAAGAPAQFMPAESARDLLDEVPQ